ncbi:hypothetical protein NQ318_023498 [Aromia moschata]|uniref:YqaJ viral recombinase domain-containing protein n=1 Tax=Aromia moschata TaxID=1265417 RepID=A0AAV8YR15_9CUCU|nr:hypothetical protein NQ318_023498 [Aromia moschata]
MSSMELNMKKRLYTVIYITITFTKYIPQDYICSLYPWLAYSADGVVVSEGKPVKILEIKCPYIAS